MKNILFPPKQKQTTPPILNEIHEAREMWQLAKINLNWANNNYIDYAIHKLNASEHRFIALLKEAKKDGLTAWPPGVDGLYTGPPEIPQTEIKKASGTHHE